MRKTRKIAAKIQSIITCFVLFMSVFFCAGMHVEATAPNGYLPYQVSVNFGSNNYLYSCLYPDSVVSSYVFDMPAISGEVFYDSIGTYDHTTYFYDSSGRVINSSSSGSVSTSRKYRYFYQSSFRVNVQLVSRYFDQPDSGFYFVDGDLVLPLLFTLPSNVGYYFYSFTPVGANYDDYVIQPTYYSSSVSIPLVRFLGKNSFRNYSEYYFSFDVNFYAMSDFYFSLPVTVTFDTSKFASYVVLKSASSSSFVTEGYVNGDMGSTSTDLNNSLSGYEQAEGSLFTSANQGVGSFQMQSLNTPALVSSMSFVSTFLQSIYTSSGGLNGFGLLPAVVFTFTFASIVVGLYRYYGGGKSG